MKPDEAIAYIESHTWSANRCGLERTRTLLAAMGNPQKKLRFIHVAGSNGKGSVCAMFDAVLRASGYRTGLYTSPYIQDFKERMRVNGDNIPGDVLARLTQRVKQYADAMEEQPSQFELMTAIAFQYFYEQHCDVVVLEVGMGGALDSTNVIEAPELAVICNIGLEHTEYLGDTLEEIAVEKAGIIKTGSACVCYDGAPQVTEVIQQVCGQRQVPLTCVDYSNMRSIRHDLSGQELEWRGQAYHLSLIGAHQLHNAALVLTGLEVLRQRGWDIPTAAVREGLRTVQWPARLEILNRSPLFILDGGHNPQCAQALIDSLDVLLPGKKVVFLTGVLADKNYQAIMDLMLPYAKAFVCVTPKSPRALPAAELQKYLNELGARAVASGALVEGILQALTLAGEDGCAVAFGSLYLAGAVRTDFRRAYRAWLRRSRIRARENRTPDERERLSQRAVEHIVSAEAFARAKTVLIYEHTRGELSLDSLKPHPASKGKCFAYPLCVSKTEMIALIPGEKSVWKTGCFGIRELVREGAQQVAPEDIDLVICPCTVFDEDGNRMGMGGGYYDRFLPKCKNAVICAAAFEVQKADAVPVEEWDRAMDIVFTEKKIYKPLP